MFRKVLPICIIHNPFSCGGEEEVPLFVGINISNYIVIVFAEGVVDFAPIFVMIGAVFVSGTAESCKTAQLPRRNPQGCCRRVCSECVTGIKKEQDNPCSYIQEDAKCRQKEIECSHPTLRLVKNTRYGAGNRT